MDTRKTITISCSKAIDKQLVYDFISVILSIKKPESFRASHFENRKSYRYSKNRFNDAFFAEMDLYDENRHISLQWAKESVSVVSYRLDQAVRIHLFLEDSFVDAIYLQLEEFICKNAIVASEANAHDTSIQNERAVHMLECAGEDTSDYPKCIGILGKEEIDIEKNPGYYYNVRGFLIGAFYRMWFGKDAYDIFDKGALSCFPCYENVILDNEVTRITLYKNIMDYKKKENRDKQWEFRKKLCIDEIGHRMQKEEEEEEKRNNDPAINIMQGRFEHGGVRLIQTYLKDGENVPRSKADCVEEVEMDEGGKEVYRCTRDL